MGIYSDHQEFIQLWVSLSPLCDIYEVDRLRKRLCYEVAPTRYFQSLDFLCIFFCHLESLKGEPK